MTIDRKMIQRGRMRARGTKLYGFTFILDKIVIRRENFPTETERDRAAFEFRKLGSTATQMYEYTLEQRRDLEKANRGWFAP